MWWNCLRCVLISLLLFAAQAHAQTKKEPLLSFDKLTDQPVPLGINPVHPIDDSCYYIVRSIDISGNKKTKAAIILRELNLAPGDTLYSSTMNVILEEKKQYLLNTSLFLNAQIFPIEIGNHDVTIEVDVIERWYFFAFPILSLADRNFNVWWVQEHHRLNRLNYGVKVYENNLNGENDRLDVNLQSGYTQAYSIHYTLPYFDKKLKQGMGIFLSYWQNHELNYESVNNKQVFFKQNYYLKKELQAGLQYTYKRAIRLQHQISLTFHSFHVNDTVLQLNPHFFPNTVNTQRYFELSYEFQYIGTDFWRYPLTGYYVDAVLDQKGLGFWSPIHETQFSMDLSKYWRLARNTYLALDTRGKIHFPKVQPYFLLKEMGYYDDYLQGLEYYVVEGDKFGIAKGNVKQKIVAMRAHTRLLPRQFSTIPFRIYVKIYGDLGYSHNSDPNTMSRLNNRLLYSYGAGIDVVTFYDIVFRMEYSFNQLGENGLFLHFQSSF